LSVLLATPSLQGGRREQGNSDALQARNCPYESTNRHLITNNVF
jgi:hypothetical protein